MRLWLPKVIKKMLAEDVERMEDVVLLMKTDNEFDGETKAAKMKKEEKKKRKKGRDQQGPSVALLLPRTTGRLHAAGGDECDLRRDLELISDISSK